MNFHKTIGYLAALLLMLGIGVPDSFAQEVAVSKITLSVTPRTLRDSTTTNVTVTATVGVTLADNAGANGQDVTITIEGTDDDSYRMSEKHRSNGTCSCRETFGKYEVSACIHIYRSCRCIYRRPIPG